MCNFAFQKFAENWKFGDANRFTLYFQEFCDWNGSNLLFFTQGVETQGRHRTSRVQKACNDKSLLVRSS